MGNTPEPEPCTGECYDHNDGMRALYFAYNAYCPADQLREWNCMRCKDQLREFDLIGVVDTGDLQMFVGYDRGFGMIVLSARGSANEDNWWTNFDILRIQYFPAKSAVNNPEIHEGIYSAYRKLKWNGGLMTVLQEASKKYPHADVLCTGHSLGGALASVACLDLKVAPKLESVRQNIGKVNVISFGEPRWCNWELANYYNNVIDTSWRVTNRYDIVTTIPPLTFGYYHVGTQIWYNYQRWWADIEELKFIQCNGSGEDDTCYGAMWTDLVPQVSHHTQYMQVPFGCGETSGAYAVVGEFLNHENRIEYDGYTNRINVAPDFVAIGLILFAVSCLINVIFCGRFLTQFSWKKTMTKAAAKAGWNEVKFVESDIEDEEVVNALNAL